MGRKSLGLTELSKSRLEAFSDGVIAIIITLMVLEIRRPTLSAAPTSDQAWQAIFSILPSVISYALSFFVIGCFWVNHHQMFHLVRRVDGVLIWLNINLLFWMSLIPLPTGFIGQYPLLPEANIAYGVVLAMSSISYLVLWRAANDRMHEAFSIGKRRRVARKNLLSTFLYLFAAGVSYASVYVAWAVFVLIPLLYFIPEKVEPG